MCQRCREIPLENGGITLVDASDFDALSSYKWYAQKYDKRIYARRNASSAEIRDGSIKHVAMHRQIMGFPEDCDIDHINRDQLDNRRSNLRLCSRGENCFNSIAPRNNTSGYKGVSLCKRSGKWKAYIRAGKWTWLGYHETPALAALAYNQAALDLHGEFAVPNEVD